MSIRADDAEKLYLQSKRKRLIQALHRIDADMNNVLQRGYKNIRTSFSTYEHDNRDIYNDIVKYYNDLGWDVKSEGQGYIVVSPSKRTLAPKPTATFLSGSGADLPAVVTPSGSFGDYSPQSQVEKMMGALENYRLKSSAPLNRITPERSQFWSSTWDKITLPFAVFWAWFKEVMK